MDIWKIKDYNGILYNKTGWFNYGQGFINLTNVSLWTAIWENFKNYSIDYQAFGSLVWYYANIFIGRVIAISFAFPDVMTSGSVARPMLGSFLYFGALTCPFSFTLYQNSPKPTTIVFDFGIVPSLVFSVIIPYWFPDV